MLDYELISLSLSLCVDFMKNLKSKKSIFKVNLLIWEIIEIFISVLGVTLFAWFKHLRRGYLLMRPSFGCFMTSPRFRYVIDNGGASWVPPIQQVMSCS